MIPRRNRLPASFQAGGGKKKLRHYQGEQNVSYAAWMIIARRGEHREAFAYKGEVLMYVDEGLAKLAYVEYTRMRDADPSRPADEAIELIGFERQAALDFGKATRTRVVENKDQFDEIMEKLRNPS